MPILFFPLGASSGGTPPPPPTPPTTTTPVGGPALWDKPDYGNSWHRESGGLTDLEVALLVRKLADLRAAKSKKQKELAAQALQKELAKAAKDDVAEAAIASTIRQAKPRINALMATEMLPLPDVKFNTELLGQVIQHLTQLHMQRIADDEDTAVLLMATL